MTFLSPAAVHEAGHAVAAQEMGLEVLSATLRPSSGLAGEVTFGDWLPDKRRDRELLERGRTEQQILAYHAGWLAEGKGAGPQAGQPVRPAGP